MGPFLSHDKVTVKKHRRSDANAIAVHRSDQRRLAGSERAKEAPHRDLVAVAVRGLEKVGQVVAGAKVLTIAAEGDDPYRVITDCPFDRIGESSVHCYRDRVAAFGPG